MDDANLTDERTARELDVLLRVRLPVPELAGTCRWCGEPVEGARVYCSPECREDAERAERFRR